MTQTSSSTRGIIAGWTFKSFSKIILTASYSFYFLRFTHACAFVCHALMDKAPVTRSCPCGVVVLTSLWCSLNLPFAVGRRSGSGRKYCDNAGCTKRRVITARTSNDGITWTNPQGGLKHNTKYTQIHAHTRVRAHLQLTAIQPPESSHLRSQDGTGWPTILWHRVSMLT